MKKPTNPFLESNSFRLVRQLAENLEIDFEDNSQIKEGLVTHAAELFVALDHGRIKFDCSADKQALFKLLAVISEFLINAPKDNKQRVDALLQPGDIPINQTDVDTLNLARLRSEELKPLGAELAVRLATYEARHSFIGGVTTVEIFNRILADGGA